MKLLNKKEFVSIVDSNTNKVIYRIRKSILDRADEDHLSAWIIQLSEKKWMYTDLLYQLAQVIIEEYPENLVDWEATFFDIEKTVAINEAIDLDNSVKNSGYAQAMKMIKLGQQFMVDGTDAKINKIVSLQLEHCGILVSNN